MDQGRPPHLARGMAPGAGREPDGDVPRVPRGDAHHVRARVRGRRRDVVAPRRGDRSRRRGLRGVQGGRARPGARVVAGGRAVRRARERHRARHDRHADGPARGASGLESRGADGAHGQDPPARSTRPALRGGQPGAVPRVATGRLHDRLARLGGRGPDGRPSVGTAAQLQQLVTRTATAKGAGPMKIISCEVTGAKVAYEHREVSSQVERDGVTSGVIRLETDDGLVGWGEACSGADMESVLDSVRSLAPFILGQDPWRPEALKRDAWHRGLWQFREPTGNFAWAGLDMAMADLCGQAAGVPVHGLLGGPMRESVDYFWYLSGDDLDALVSSAALGRSSGYGTFYVKVGRNRRDDLERVFAVRSAIGEQCRLRIDANGAWSFAEARDVLAAMGDAHLDFVEQPVRQVPRDLLGDLRRVVSVPVAANEGLWSEEQARERIEARVADVYCFSPYWVGSLRGFQRLGHLAYEHGGLVCKHTRSEEHTSELQSRQYLVCRLLLEK